MARRFLSLESILNRGRLSFFFRCSPCAISPGDAGALLTCRKRNMLSGLKCEGRDIGFSRQKAGASFHRDSRQFFWDSQELFSGAGDYIGRPTHDRLVALRLTGRIPREGIEGRRDDLARLPFHFHAPTPDVKAPINDSGIHRATVVKNG